MTLSLSTLRLAATAAAAAGSVLAVASPGFGRDLPRAMSDSDLAATRGGYLTAGGFTFGFGAIVKTYVDGSLALQTTLNLTASGPVIVQSPAMGSATGREIVIPGQGGATALLQSLSQNQILNVVTNNADNRTIRQDTALTLTLPGFKQMQSNIAAAGLANSLSNALAFSAVHGAH